MKYRKICAAGICAVSMLLSTGTLAAAENLEMVPVMDSQAEQQGLTYQDIAGWEYIFSSGVGAWGTFLTIQEDGTFEGEYGDTDMGDTGEGYPDGTRYVCNFTGRFSELKKVNEYTYSAGIENLELAKEPETADYVDGMRIVYSEPYGINDTESVLFFTEGTPMTELPGPYKDWIQNSGTDISDSAVLPYIGIYNETEELGFVGIKENGMEEAVSGIDAELAELEAREAELNQKANDYADQATHNITAQEIYTLWDDKLNSMWAEIREILPEDSFDALTQEQLDWITAKEAAMAAAVKEVNGGSMSASVEYGTGGRLTKERVYYLAEYLR